MANAKSLAGLMKWLHREEWHNAFDELQERHLGRACTKAGIAIEELADVLGEQHSSVLWGCVFEDLLARDLDDGRNIVDDYLRRRGWKESASARTYMLALRSSVVSCWCNRPYTMRKRRLSSITRLPCRKVTGMPGQRWHAAR
jgi:hypothetical protein